jgi:hypothetical protein
MPLRRLLSLAALSLSSATLGLCCALLALSFLPGDFLSLAAIAGLAVLLRSLVLRQQMASSANGFILAATSVPFCAVLLPGGLLSLCARHAVLSRAVGVLQLPQLPWALTLTHAEQAALLGVRGNSARLAALSAVTAAALLLTAALHRSFQGSRRKQQQLEALPRGSPCCELPESTSPTHGSSPERVELPADSSSAAQKKKR